MIEAKDPIKIISKITPKYCTLINNSNDPSYVSSSKTINQILKLSKKSANDEVILTSFPSSDFSLKSYQINSSKLHNNCLNNISPGFSPNSNYDNDTTMTVNSTQIAVFPYKSLLSGIRPRKLHCNFTINKEKLRNLFEFDMSIAENVHNLGLYILNNKKLHIARQIMIIIGLFIISLFAKELKSFDTTVIIHVLNVASTIAYFLFQNSLYCLMNDRFNVEKCFPSRSEAHLTLTFLYTVMAFTRNMFLIGMILQSYGNFSISILLYFVLNFQLLFDGHLLQIFCPIIFILFTLAIILLGFAVYTCELFVFLFINKCHNESFEELINNRNKEILKAIEKMNWKYTETNKEAICVICLESYLNKKVVRMDCDENHILHKNCIYEWLCKENSCPICNQKVFLSDFYNIE